MDNQHRQIKGYRELSQGEIDLMNEIKEEGLRLEALMLKVNNHISIQYSSIESKEEEDRLDHTAPENWAATAKLQFQQGLMALTRSVAQPGFF